NISGTGTVNLGTNTLIIGGDNSNASFSGTITGSSAAGLTKNGTGAFQIQASVSYPGPTTINAGDFGAQSNMSSTAVIVNSGGTFKGTPIFSTIQVNSGGKLLPSFNSGGMSGGSVTFASGSTFQADISGTTAQTTYSQLKVSSVATLGNANLVIG